MFFVDKIALYKKLRAVTAAVAGLLLWVAVLLVLPAQASQAAGLNVEAKNAMTGVPLASLNVYAFEKGPADQMTYRKQGITDSQGKVSLELPGLGLGTTYVLFSAPYINSLIDLRDRFRKKK